MKLCPVGSSAGNRVAELECDPPAVANSKFPELRELILVGASALELRRKAVDEGMITLRGSGLRKVQAGVTSIEEVVRETVK